jgi:hypothetical protein
MPQASGAETSPNLYRSFASFGGFASACCRRRVIAGEFGFRRAVIFPNGSQKPHDAPIIRWTPALRGVLRRPDDE